jgi:hypothetical protein
MALLGLGPRRFALDACGLGWPANDAEPRRLPELADVTRWLE